MQYTNFKYFILYPYTKIGKQKGKEIMNNIHAED